MSGLPELNLDKLKISDSTASTVDNGSKCTSRLAMLFNSPKFSDIVLLLRGEEYYAHKLLLSTASDVFEQMLTNHTWQDSQMPCVELQEHDDCVPVFGDFLRFLRL